MAKTGVLPFLRGIDFSQNDFKVSCPSSALFLSDLWVVLLVYDMCMWVTKKVGNESDIVYDLLLAEQTLSGLCEGNELLEMASTG